MTCFLFPKDFSLNSGLSSIVLKDGNHNKISIPIKTSIHTENEEYFEKLVLSEIDLRAIYGKVSQSYSHLSLNRQNETNYLESFFRNQISKINSMSSESAIKTEKHYFPTLEECLSSKNFVIKTFDQVQMMLDDKIVEEPIANELPDILLENSGNWDLDSIKEFVTEFKNYRLGLGMTQTDVGISMGIHLESEFSQTTICRFESLSLSMINMIGLIPYFRKWISKLHEANTEAKIAKSGENSQISNNTDTSKQQIKEEKITQTKPPEADLIEKRRRSRRTMFSDAQLNRMEELFQTVQFTQITSNVFMKLSKELKIEKKKIQTWMTKRRQQARFELALLNKK